MNKTLYRDGHVPQVGDVVRFAARWNSYPEGERVTIKSVNPIDGSSVSIEDAEGCVEHEISPVLFDLLVPGKAEMATDEYREILAWEALKLKSEGKIAYQRGPNGWEVLAGYWLSNSYAVRVDPLEGIGTPESSTEQLVKMFKAIEPFAWWTDSEKERTRSAILSLWELEKASNHTKPINAANVYSSGQKPKIGDLVEVIDIAENRLSLCQILPDERRIVELSDHVGSVQFSGGSDYWSPPRFRLIRSADFRYASGEIPHGGDLVEWNGRHSVVAEVDPINCVVRFAQKGSVLRVSGIDVPCRLLKKVQR